MPTILAMIDEAADWLETKGTDQWARPWPSQASRDERIRRGLKKKKTWMVEMDGLPVATVTLRRHGNRRLWTWMERRKRSVYLSRLVVRRDFAGQSIGAHLIDWAGVRGRRDWRAHWIRIDVWTTNGALHNYYEKRGFRSHGNQRPAKINNYPSAALFQKPVSEVDVTAAERFTQATTPVGCASPRLFRLSPTSSRSGPGQARTPDRHMEPEVPGLPVVQAAADRELAHEASAG